MGSFEKKLEQFCSGHGLTCSWQPLKFGFRRAIITCESESDYRMIQQNVKRQLPLAHIDTWHCRLGGFFDGRIYVMDHQSHDELDRRLKAEQEACEDWWQRYHAADSQTRRLMACGALS